MNVILLLLNFKCLKVITRMKSEEKVKINNQIVIQIKIKVSEVVIKKDLIKVY